MRLSILLTLLTKLKTPAKSGRFVFKRESRPFGRLLDCKQLVFTAHTNIATTKRGIVAVFLATITSIATTLATLAKATAVIAVRASVATVAAFAIGATSATIRFVKQTVVVIQINVLFVIFFHQILLHKRSYKLREFNLLIYCNRLC